jgi:hypothetical protein
MGRARSAPVTPTAWAPVVRGGGGARTEMFGWKSIDGSGLVGTGWEVGLVGRFALGWIIGRWAEKNNGGSGQLTVLVLL